MAILGTFIQQPADVLDYEVNYGEWLHGDDLILSATASVDPSVPSGLMVQAPLVMPDGRSLKLWVSKGESGVVYKVTVTMTTELGRVKQDELRFRIRDF